MIFGVSLESYIPLNQLDLFNKTAVIILGAGESSRMNFPKALLKFDATSTFVEKIIHEYVDFGIPEVVVVTNQKNKSAISSLLKYNWISKVKIVVNDKVNLGKLYSVKSGLNILSPAIKFCYIQDVDRPFVNRNLLLQLFSNKLLLGFTSLIYKSKRGHPILIGRNVIKVLKKWSDFNLTLAEVLEEFPCLESSTVNKNIIININTPQDYNIHFKSLADD